MRSAPLADIAAELGLGPDGYRASVGLVPPSGRWALAAVMAEAEDRGMRCAVAEGVFCTTVGPDDSTPASDPPSVQDRLAAYRGHDAWMTTCAIAAEVADPRDLHWLRASIYQAARLLDGIALVISSTCLLYTSPSPRDKRQSRMPSSA